ncbi:membrane-bound lytic murein transglycosylase MltC [Arcobacter sp. FWKO B]|uniref:membrane-bound lytic murein transglycosylase MltC n=1 Tax=Arcobacter sp. FWKO B TaxID=2593672 RepID=UPI0018A40EF1|nr:membrane-bound lytic murein transglycosylase MltC [Arcobacter sp. FWKO B]QOG11662.1 membrane-bound lytic murein transglycosylase MltC [Arcobacter sp. FWKO B]
MKKFLFAFSVIFFAGCTASDIQAITQAAMSKDPIGTIGQIAQRRVINYTSVELAKIIEAFKKEVERNWGNEAKTPSPKEYVKYTQNYKSMAHVNFDKGEILVQTLDNKNPTNSLKSAIITTLLTPEDPRAVDLYSDAEIKLSGTPYLYKTVMDHTGNYISSKSRASNFADFLIKNNLQTKTINHNGKSELVHFVQIQMVKNHLQVRAQKYKPLVQRYSKEYNLSQSLIFAIMKTESDFNPFAISNANAIGLMQIVPTSAGRDVNKFLYNKDITPSRDFLYDAKNNIQFGSTYLHMLNTNYLSRVNNPISREYCIIAGYNTGAGNVLKTFSNDRTKAFEIINSMNPNDVYKKLRSSLPYNETRRYLYKVIESKKEFTNL